MRSTALFLGILASATAVAAPTAKPAFIADDYARARAEATARALPLFIEVWAPW